jgi:4-aminobutyrate aminotransferase-like enzyme
MSNKHFPLYRFLPLRRWFYPEQTQKLSDLFHKKSSDFIETYEAVCPSQVTANPGPKAQAILNNMSMVSATTNPREVIDLAKSFGNYFTDVDGNVVMDMHMDNGSNSFGYNHRSLIMDTKMDKFERYLVQRPSLGFAPPEEYPSWLLNNLSRIAPANVPDVVLTCGCASSANETAIKVAFLYHHYLLK